MCRCSVVQESMWWNGNQIRDSMLLSLLFRAGCIALVLGSGHFEEIEIAWSASELKGETTHYYAE